MEISTISNLSAHPSFIDRHDNEFGDDNDDGSSSTDNDGNDGGRDNVVGVPPHLLLSSSPARSSSDGEGELGDDEIIVNVMDTSMQSRKRFCKNKIKSSTSASLSSMTSKNVKLQQSSPNHHHSSSLSTAAENGTGRSSDHYHQYQQSSAVVNNDTMNSKQSRDQGSQTQKSISQGVNKTSGSPKHKPTFHRSKRPGHSKTSASAKPPPSTGLEYDISSNNAPSTSSSSVAGFTKISPSSQSPEQKRGEVELLERLVKTHPIWYLPHISRTAASHLLKRKEPGSFIVRESSRPGTMAISIRLGLSSFISSNSLLLLDGSVHSSLGSHSLTNNSTSTTVMEMDHYLIETTKAGIHLEGSPNYFPVLPLLLRHYSVNGEELRTRLKLPTALMNCQSRRELQSFALLGHDFWTSEHAEYHPPPEVNDGNLMMLTTATDSSSLILQSSVQTLSLDDSHLSFEMSASATGGGVGYGDCQQLSPQPTFETPLNPQIRSENPVELSEDNILNHPSSSCQSLLIPTSNNNDKNNLRRPSSSTSNRSASSSSMLSSSKRKSRGGSKNKVITAESPLYHYGHSTNNNNNTNTDYEGREKECTCPSPTAATATGPPASLSNKSLLDDAASFKEGNDNNNKDTATALEDPWMIKSQSAHDRLLSTSVSSVTSVTSPSSSSAAPTDNNKQKQNQTAASADQLDSKEDQPIFGHTNSQARKKSRSGSLSGSIASRFSTTSGGSLKETEKSGKFRLRNWLFSASERDSRNQQRSRDGFTILANDAAVREMFGSPPAPPPIATASSNHPPTSAMDFLHSNRQTNQLCSSPSRNRKKMHTFKPQLSTNKTSPPSSNNNQHNNRDMLDNPLDLAMQREKYRQGSLRSAPAPPPKPGHLRREKSDLGPCTTAAAGFLTVNHQKTKTTNDQQQISKRGGVVNGKLGGHQQQQQQSTVVPNPNFHHAQGGHNHHTLHNPKKSSFSPTRTTTTSSPSSSSSTSDQQQQLVLDKNSSQSFVKCVEELRQKRIDSSPRLQKTGLIQTRADGSPGVPYKNAPSIQNSDFGPQPTTASPQPHSHQHQRQLIVLPEGVGVMRNKTALIPPNNNNNNNNNHNADDNNGQQQSSKNGRKKEHRLSAPNLNSSEGKPIAGVLPQPKQGSMRIGGRGPSGELTTINEGLVTPVAQRRKFFDSPQNQNRFFNETTGGLGLRRTDVLRHEANAQSASEKRFSQSLEDLLKEAEFNNNNNNNATNQTNNDKNGQHNNNNNNSHGKGQSYFGRKFGGSDRQSSPRKQQQQQAASSGQQQQPTLGSGMIHCDNSLGKRSTTTTTTTTTTTNNNSNSNNSKNDFKWNQVNNELKSRQKIAKVSPSFQSSSSSSSSATNNNHHARNNNNHNNNNNNAVLIQPIQSSSSSSDQNRHHHDRNFEKINFKKPFGQGRSFPKDRRHPTGNHNSDDYSRLSEISEFAMSTNINNSSNHRRPIVPVSPPTVNYQTSMTAADDRASEVSTETNDDDTLSQAGTVFNEPWDSAMWENLIDITSANGQPRRLISDTPARTNTANIKKLITTAEKENENGGGQQHLHVQQHFHHDPAYGSVTAVQLEYRKQLKDGMNGVEINGTTDHQRSTGQASPISLDDNDENNAVVGALVTMSNDNSNKGMNGTNSTTASTTTNTSGQIPLLQQDDGNNINSSFSSYHHQNESPSHHQKQQQNHPHSHQEQQQEMTGTNRSTSSTSSNNINKHNHQQSKESPTSTNNLTIPSSNNHHHNYHHNSHHNNDPWSLSNGVANNHIPEMLSSGDHGGTMNLLGTGGVPTASTSSLMSNSCAFDLPNPIITATTTTTTTNSTNGSTRILGSTKRAKDAQTPGYNVQQYILKLSADENTIFGGTVLQFVECTLEGSETDPKIVTRNTRQFMNGIKNYLTKHGEGSLHDVIEQERSKLRANELLNIDAILEAVLHRIILRPLKSHLYHLMTWHFVRQGSLKVLSDNLTEIREMDPSKLGLESHCIPDSEELEKIHQDLRKMQSLSSPLHKMEQFLQICRLSNKYFLPNKLSNSISMASSLRDVDNCDGSTVSITTSSGNESSDRKNKDLPPADDLVRWLVFVIAKSGMIGVEIEADYTLSLLPQPLLTGETSYFLTALFSAVHILKHQECWPKLANRELGDTATLLGIEGPLQAVNNAATPSPRGTAISDGLVRIAIPDECSGSIEYHSFPAVAIMTAGKLCSMIAHKNGITNPEDHGLYLLVDGYETCLLKSECPVPIRQELCSANKLHMFAYKRHEAKIAWPKVAMSPRV